MKPKFLFLTTSLVLASIALGGCSNVRQTMGLERNKPDEFRVVSRAPLTVPPDFTLRPPKPGTDNNSETTPKDQAAQTLLGGNPSDSAPSGSTSTREAKLLEQTGANKADPNIKAVIERETEQLVDANKTLLDRITKFDPSAVTVNPAEEKERLEKNKEQGLPANSGTVPTIKPRRKGLL